MKKIKPILAYITDTHLKKGNEELVMSVFLQCFKKCDEIGIKTLLFGGDFFTSREAQPLDTLDTAKRIFELAEDYGITIEGIPGNHDKVSLTSDRSYLDIFSKSFNLHRQPTIKTIEGKVIGFLPYYKEDKLLEIIQPFKDKVLETELDLLITHLAVTGVRNNDGTLVNNNIDSKLFSNAKKVLVGHYHNKSHIKPNIYYLGSAYQKDFGETDEKGFTIISSDLSLEHIELEFPKYIKLVVDIKDRKKLKELESNKEKNTNFVRVELSGTKEELKAFDKTKLEQVGLDIKFDKQEVRVDGDDELVYFDRSNIKEYFDRFVELNDIDDVETGEEYLQSIL
jgi:DNA repair exonuclease SbcCD nuclease subunit